MGSGGNQEAVKPTPGPWVVHGRNSPREPIVVGHDEIGPRRTLAKVYQPAGTKDAEANARLIAAAPELFEAAVDAEVEIRELRAWIDSIPSKLIASEKWEKLHKPIVSTVVGRNLRAALAKARGESA